MRAPDFPFCRCSRSCITQLCARITSADKNTYVIAVSLDIGSSSRLPSTGPSPGTSSGVASSSPRRQRPSRTGPRRHMAAPRSPSHAHGRHSIDRSLVQEFLDSQNIGPADRIGNYTYPVIEELMLRNLQALHGSMGHAKVARKSMVKALAHVPVEDLPEDERSE